MPRKQQPENQLVLDYSVSGNRMVICLGHKQSYIASEYLFSQLMCHEICMDTAEEIAEVSSAVPNMDALAYKLPYPDGMRVAELSNWDDDFIGFSAIIDQKGWVFLSKSLHSHERSYYLHLLTISLGLNTFYTNVLSLKYRSEKLVVNRFVPSNKLSDFFKSNNHAEPNELCELGERTFQIPYSILLKTALERAIITSVQYHLLQVEGDLTCKKTSEKVVSDEEIACISDGQLFIEGFGF
jgi:hypothetical protein